MRKRRSIIIRCGLLVSITPKNCIKYKMGEVKVVYFNSLFGSKAAGG